MNSSNPSDSRTCPCKRIPWSISSFTAAEFGDLHSLLRQRPGAEVWNRRDSAGSTVLHLTAQHNHVAATNTLLQLGANVNGRIEGDGTREKSGFTPLHRAAFSGATATMRLLLEKPDCDAMARDFSFGDQKTPLHKAATGGRFLAVQLLISELRSRGLLEEALHATDSNVQTPLEVAENILPYEEDERECVARWDAVAGGRADWSKCIKLLRAAEEVGSSSADVENPPAALPLLPSQLSNLSTCVDCDSSSGQCPTASWQSAFQAALESAVDSSLSIDPESSNQIRQKIGPEGVKLQVSESTEKGPTVDSNLAAGGTTCQMCKKETVSVFKLSTGLLVCRSCRRSAR